MNHAPRRRTSILNGAEFCLFLLVGFWAIALILMVCFNAGALWRDEINTVWIAQRAPISEWWRWLENDSYPLVWFMVIRAWSLLGLGATDLGLRGLGAVIGIGQLLAIIWVARLQAKRWPLLFIALFALTPIMFRFSTSLRAHGATNLTLFIMVGCVGLFIDRPTTRRFFIALVGSLLAVQTSYYNAIVLFVLCCTGAVLFFREKRIREIVRLGVIGIISASSVLPYVLGPMVRAREWTPLVKSPNTVPLLPSLAAAIEGLSTGVSGLWLLLMLVVYIGCLRGLMKWRSPRKRRRALFILISGPLLFILHFGFLRLLGYAAQPWYFSTLVAFTALLIDRGADLLIRSRRTWRYARIGIVIVLVAWTFKGDLYDAHIRATTIDRIASIIDQNATADDLILVTPFSNGIPFNRYYHGATPWTTVPSIRDLNLHRYDLLKEQLRDPEAIDPIKEKIRRTLDSGHRVWYIGYLTIPRPGEVPDPIPPWPMVGEFHVIYDMYWQNQIGFELKRHSASASAVNLQFDQPVSDYESPPLFIFQGRVPTSGPSQH